MLSDLPVSTWCFQKKNLQEGVKLAMSLQPPGTSHSRASPHLAFRNPLNIFSLIFLPAFMGFNSTWFQESKSFNSVPPIGLCLSLGFKFLFACNICSLVGSRKGVNLKFIQLFFFFYCKCGNNVFVSS